MEGMEEQAWKGIERCRTDGNRWGDQNGRLGGDNCISRSPEGPTEETRFSLVAHGRSFSKQSLLKFTHLTKSEHILVLPNNKWININQSYSSNLFSFNVWRNATESFSLVFYSPMATSVHSSLPPSLVFLADSLMPKLN